MENNPTSGQDGGRAAGLSDTAVPPTAKGSLMHVSSPQQIEEANNAEMAEMLEADKPDEIDPLIGFFMAIIDENRYHRETEGIDDALIEGEYRAQSKYPPRKIQEIRDFGGSEVFMGLTGVKVRAADAWMKEILTTDREQLWRIEPTPITNIPKPLAEQMAETAVKRIRQLQAEAEQNGTPLELTPAVIYDLSASVRDEVLAERKRKAEISVQRMEQTIHDQMIEMDFEATFREVITDVCRNKVAIMKGPIPVAVECRGWTVDKEGKPKIIKERKIVPKVYRIEPKDFFPSPVHKKANKGNTVERVYFDRGELAALRDQPNYSTAEINRALDNFNHTEKPIEYSTESDDLKHIDYDDENVSRTVARGWEVWAVVDGRRLLDFGFEFDRDGKTPLDPNGAYDVNVLLVNSRIIYLNHNPDEYGSRPYSSTGWAEIVGSLWFQAIWELMTDLQDVCNGCARALCNNMAFASGPQSVINDVARLPDGEELTPPHPLKMWQFTNVHKVATKPIDFFQPNSNAQELLAVYDRFAKLADDYTGIPAYAYGNDRVAGAGRTASGLSMLMSSAARGIKNVILRIDKEILNKVIRDLYFYNLQYSDDESLKHGADINVRATGAIQIMIKESMAARRLEFLQATANDIDFKVIGEENRARLLSDIASTLDLDFNPVKSQEQISEMIQQEAQMAQQQREVELAELQRQAQKDEAEIALKAAETALNYAKAESESKIEQQKVAQQGGAEGGIE
jgi:hypothetical protein